MESATILTNLTGIPSGPVDVSDINYFSTRRTSPWDTSRSLKLVGLSSGQLVLQDRKVANFNKGNSN